MSNYDAARIEKPMHFRLAPLIRGRGKRSVTSIGFDSEQDTETATPMLFQYNDHGERDDTTLAEIINKRHRALEQFMSWLHTSCTRKDTEYIIWVFNAQYEFTQLFGDLEKINTEDEYKFRYRLLDASDNLLASYEIHVTNSKRFGVTFLNEKTHRRVKMIDAAAFYPGQSLDSLSKMLDIGRKADIATKKFTRRDLTGNPMFLEYARQDAYLTRRIGEFIVDMHETYDVPTCITAPHFAARVFRHHFLNAEIPLPDPDLEQAGLYAYHGGKNGYYLGGPMHLSNVYSYDITSAYPEAMRQLPNIEASQWVFDDRTYVPGRHGVVKVVGEYRSCKYRGIMQHGNDWHATGTIEGWTTTYELDEAISRNEIDVHSVEGWYMEGEPGGPLVAYVDTFFAQKRTAVGAARNAAKLFLNSLYGKFFQKVPLGIVGYYDAETLDDLGNVRYIETDPDADYDYQAGGLYHPPIAALITGFVRAKIHRLEHKYRALMTSTDGFFARDAPDPDDIGSDLGMLTVERGDLSIWRERLYDFKPNNADSKSKYALHGFRGTIAELRKIPLAMGKYTYSAQQVITNKLARNSYRGKRFRPGTFAMLEFVLLLGTGDGTDSDP